MRMQSESALGSRFSRGSESCLAFQEVTEVAGVRQPPCGLRRQVTKANEGPLELRRKQKVHAGRRKAGEGRGEREN